jgi:hypothetical protein
VAYSDSRVPGFDDVVTYYRAGNTDDQGQQVTADCRQVKFHKYGSGALTAAALDDPKFIDAVESVLQRLHRAVCSGAGSGGSRRLWFCSPWGVPHDDLLADVWRQDDGGIEVAKLRSARPRSKLDMLWRRWRDHVEVDDGELAGSLAALRICRLPSMQELKGHLNDGLRLAGLKPVADSHALHEYDELIRKLVERGQSEFGASDLDAILVQHRLRVGPPFVPAQAIHIRVQSFTRGAERVPVTLDHDLCLLDLFDGRDLRPGLSWGMDLPERVREFAAALPRGRPLRLRIPSHLSIAFTAGYYMDPKTGLDIAVIQPTIGGEAVWPTASPQGSSELPAWRFDDAILASSGDEVAVALNVTHDIVADVRSYVQSELPQVGRIISCHLGCGPGPASVASGACAAHLSDQLISYLRAQRTSSRHWAVLHLFAAAPNGLLLMLGQRARALGACQLYEHNFETDVLPSYQPSIRCPLP